MFQAAQLITSVLNRAASPGQKQLELTPGQVVAGRVVRLLPDSQALVQVGGTQVLAKLETPLEAGRTAWLQVQPSGSPVTLKVLHTADETGQQPSAGALLRTLGIADTAQSRALVAALIQQHLPVSRESISAFLAAAQRLGGMDDGLVEAFLLAVRRNLPVTDSVLAGLRAFFSGDSLVESIGSFGRQAELFLQTHSSGAAGESRVASANGLPQLIAALRGKLAELPVDLSQLSSRAGQSAKELPPTPSALLPASQSQASAAPGIAAPSLPGGLQVAMGQPTGREYPVPPAQAGQSVQPGQAGAEGSPLAGRFAAGGLAPGTNGLGSVSSADVVAEAETRPAAKPEIRPGVNSQNLVSGQQPSYPIASGSASVLPASSGMPDSSKAWVRAAGLGTPDPVRTQAENPLQQSAASRSTGQPDQTSVQQPSQIPASAEDHLGPASAEQRKGEQLRELFHNLGMRHEREIAQSQIQLGGRFAADSRLETVKGMLLQVLQQHADALPAGLRQSAENLLQQITGQQLMLIQPGSQSISQVVMQIPLRTEQGEQTAFVQIESRRQGGGQLDPENCRLFFNLDLDALGVTMIDVNIVNRIVNVSIFNDQPWLDPLVHGAKQAFARQLGEVGYQLSGLRVQPIPAEAGDVPGSAEVKAGLFARYEGVDLRL
jgi:hypothetical protein